MNFLNQFANQFSQSNKITNSDWIQIGVLLVALFALIYQPIRHWWNKHHENTAVKAALLQELLANMHGLFNEGIERPFLFTVFESFLEKQSYKLKDKNSQSEFQKLISLYTDLMDYRAVTDKFWPPGKVDVFMSNLICTKKQVGTINKFLQYFDEKPVTMKDDMKVLETSREQAQLLRNKQQEIWHRQLKKNIESII